MDGLNATNWLKFCSFLTHWLVEFVVHKIRRSWASANVWPVGQSLFARLGQSFVPFEEFKQPWLNLVNLGLGFWALFELKQ